ncbi:helix-turn-helix transcriptional regulator [Tyzzerella sp. OttesenSCG-928-J15]|nr:helix-turn-helix transcriptional regulator [Tyzzerella sp. OttesenSCG-928-J15]
MFIMNHTLESLSEKFNINPTYICQLFSKHLNTTFISYLTDLRMEKASALLLKTDKTIKEIAVLSGYNDYFYFCRVFKEHFNVPPSKFRKAALANENPKG